MAEGDCGARAGDNKLLQCLAVFHLHEAGWVTVPGSQRECCLLAAMRNLTVQLRSRGGPNERLPAVQPPNLTSIQYSPRFGKIVLSNSKAVQYKEVQFYFY